MPTLWCVQEKGFLGGDRFVDIGGEYVHGAESILARLVRSQGWEQTPSFDFSVPEGERMLLGASPGSGG